MHTIEINLPDSYDFRRAGFTMALTLSDFTPEVLAQAALHGLVQTIGDAASAAASGAWEAQRKETDPDWKSLPAADKKAWSTANAAKIAEVGEALMLKRIDALKTGEWTTRRDSAEGLDEFQTECAQIVKGQMTFDKGVATAERLRLAFVAFEALPADKRELVAKLAKQELERRRAIAQMGLKLVL